MPSLVKITADRFPDVYAELLCHWEPRLPEATWRRAFTPQWPTDEDHFGYALADKGRLVGVLGVLFSARQIDGRTFRFGNLHSWSVQPEYRGLSLLLMKPVLALTDHTLTDFTPTPRVAEISKRLGMKQLDHWAYILPPLPAAGKRPRAAIDELTPTTDPAAAPESALQACRHHAACRLQHLLLRDGDATCHIAFSVVERHRLPYCNVHEVSSPRLFARHHAAVRRRLLERSRCAYVVVDSRLLAGSRPPFAFRVRATEKLFRSPDLMPHQINSLYSEMVLLEHTTLPGLRARLSALKAYLPLRSAKQTAISSPSGRGQG